VVGHDVRPVGPRRGFWVFLIVFSKVFAESYFCSRYTCAEWDPLGSRHRALCRPSGAEWAVPRVPSRHRLCREYSGLCREELALGTAPDSGSVGNRGRGCYCKSRSIRGGRRVVLCKIVRTYLAGHTMEIRWL
jgi:hypothetical protein